jgi:hypothetical protein
MQMIDTIVADQKHNANKPDISHQPYEAAVAALQKLAEVEGCDAAERAAKAVLGPIREKRFRDRPRLKKAGGRLCAKRLSGKTCTVAGAAGCECFPKVASDHNSLWNVAGKPAVYLAQPYGLSLDEMESIVNYCRKFGLQCTIDAANSWHFPGRTLNVEITPQ